MKPDNDDGQIITVWLIMICLLIMILTWALGIAVGAM